MRIIGITGPIGSGKSTVTGILREHGAGVIDADKVAREVVRKGEKALDELVVYFGSDILDENGELLRSKLADKVFGNKEKVKKLNEITHKHVIERILGYVEQARLNARQGDILVIDVPIPVEHGFLDIVDEVWVVHADMETRISRVMKRSNLSRQEVMDRINSQMSDEEYLKLADRVIHNDGSMEELRREVLKML